MRSPLILRLTFLRLQPAPVRILACLLLLGLGWLPVAAILRLLIPDLDTANLIALIALLLFFLGWVRLWGRSVHLDPRPLQRYGLVWNRACGLAFFRGLGLGVGSLGLLLGLETLLGWVVLSPANLSLRIVLEGVVVGLGVGFAEEIFFRGWLLDELQRDYTAPIALGLNSVIFALLHFLRPVEEMLRILPAFPGLVVLGIVLVWAKWGSVGWDRRSPFGYLGMPIGLHSGLVWASYIFFVGEVVEATGAVPAWVTGLDQNPLAGVMGLGCLAILAGLIRWRSHYTRRPLIPGNL